MTLVDATPPRPVRCSDLAAWQAWVYNRTCDCCGVFRHGEEPGVRYCTTCYQSELAGPDLQAGLASPPRAHILLPQLFMADPSLRNTPLPPFRPRTWRRAIARRHGRPGRRIHQGVVSLPGAWRSPRGAS